MLPPDMLGGAFAPASQGLGGLFGNGGVRGILGNLRNPQQPQQPQGGGGIGGLFGAFADPLGAAGMPSPFGNIGGNLPSSSGGIGGMLGSIGGFLADPLNIFGGGGAPPPPVKPNIVGSNISAPGLDTSQIQWGPGLGPGHAPQMRVAPNYAPAQQGHAPQMRQAPSQQGQMQGGFGGGRFGQQFVTAAPGGDWTPTGQAGPSAGFRSTGQNTWQRG